MAKYKNGKNNSRHRRNHHHNYTADLRSCHIDSYRGRSHNYVYNQKYSCNYHCFRLMWTKVAYLMISFRLTYFSKLVSFSKLSIGVTISPIWWTLHCTRITLVWRVASWITWPIRSTTTSRNTIGATIWQFTSRDIYNVFFHNISPQRYLCLL